ncbi:MAG: ArsC family reductase [Giesbergeria sp.]|jgi:Spx/MgsR family transcriptional regulator|nr:ArsC family reductase [Giesbergeria sp.]
MKTPDITLYGITNCDTVKKARAWLTAQGLEYRFHDFKKLGVPPAPLALWLEQAGWEKLLNRQGTTWRKLDAATQAAVHDAASARSLMLEQPSIIKRPVVEWRHEGAVRVTVGFDAPQWSQCANNSPIV